MKRLIIINGVSGAVGSACLALLSREPDNVIYGLSRKALSYEEFLKEGFLPSKTLICSIGDIVKDVNGFPSSINYSKYQEIVYIHCVGLYLLEVNSKGVLSYENDNDRDGINDEVNKLSHDAFISTVSVLSEKGMPIKAFIFGGIADKHKPLVYRSWYRVMEKVKSSAVKLAQINPFVSIARINISSVICPNELIARPFVFTDTDAEGCYWLMPHEVAVEVKSLVQNIKNEFTEVDLFHPSKYYHGDYFEDQPFIERKRREIRLNKK